MDSSLWARMHGGATHFPIGLLIAATLFDLVGFLANREKLSRDLHAAAFYTIVLAALGSIGAVLTGVLLTAGNMWGKGLLLKHHQFVWPSFALLVGLAVWRVYIRDRASRGALGVYVTVSVVAAVLIGAAGYWGGEMLLGGRS
jgi:uncharacterized membrane protein